DQGEMNKGDDHHVELLEAGEDASKALQTAKQPLDFVAPFVDGLAVVPSCDAGYLGRHHRNKSESQRQLSRFVTLVGAVHDQVQAPARWAQRFKQLAPLGRIVRLASRKGKGYCRSSIRGNHMNFGGPSPWGSADGLRAVFFSAPVPSGCTLTMVLSSA